MAASWTSDNSPAAAKPTESGYWLNRILACGGGGIDDAPPASPMEGIEPKSVYDLADEAALAEALAGAAESTEGRQGGGGDASCGDDDDEGGFESEYAA